jgi:hypothetical protein
VGLWEDGIDRIWEAFQSINAGNEDVFHATVLQFCEDVQPRLGAFIL